jgi:ribosomal protein L37AE/L43A
MLPYRSIAMAYATLGRMSELKTCPDCGSSLLIRIGDGAHCNACSADFIDSRATVNGATKAELAATHDLDASIGKSFGRFGWK